MEWIEVFVSTSQMGLEPVEGVLYECGLAEKVIGYFKELIAGPGAVRATLKKYI